jgi:threonine synthase
MRLISTRGASTPVDLRTALLAGTAPDGGLYVPEQLAPIAADALAAIAETPAAEPTDLRPVARLAARHLLAGDLAPATIDDVVDRALDFPVPRVELGSGLALLELFWGPTLAFKDVGARFMAHLLRELVTDIALEPYTVLAATSGDTGSAVAQAFHGLAGFRVVVLFPAQGVSAAQRRQFSTLGGNVRAVALHGTFDDCQGLVKGAFADPELRTARLVSANSINIGRLLPQAFYHLNLALRQRPRSGRPLAVVVPSGNFGNVAAGLLAKRLGAPIDHLIAATNANDVVPVWLETGGDLKPRPSVATVSNAMDIGNPSNVERIRWLYGDDLEALRRDLSAVSVSDEQTLQTMAAVHREHSLLIDPHTAVGVHAATSLRSRLPGHDFVVLATAHAAKFADVVVRATGVEPSMPPALDRVMRVPEQVEEVAPDIRDLRSLILGPFGS